MHTLLIRNGTVVSSRGVNREDVLVVDDVVHAVGNLVSGQADAEIDATGCYVLPGGIDAHTHMELPQMGTVSSDSFPTGTKAALFGGTTTIIDFANQVRGETLRQTIEKSLATAGGRSACDYAFHVAVTDASSAVISEIAEMVQRFGVTSFKTFLAYDALRLSEESLARVMSAVNKMGGMVTVHAEVGDVIKNAIATEVVAGHREPRYHRTAHSISAEADATATALLLGKQTGCPVYIVHVTNAEALNHIVAAKAAGQIVFGETCPQYLFLDESLYNLPFCESAKYVMSPPLRGKSDQTALWNGLVNGALDVIATDHCPFFMAQKEAGRDDFSKIPNGAPGVEHRVELLFSEGVNGGKMSLQRFIEITALLPAKLFGLYPKKGDLLVGSDADMVILDPNYEHTISSTTHHMNVDYSVFEGMKLRGKCRTVVLRGQVMVQDGLFVGSETCGLYLRRKGHST